MNQIADLITQKTDPEDVFELLDILGQGSYGSVSKALHKQTGELYAVKILPATSGVQIASIKKQIGILKQCDDDHIVRYYGSYFKDNNLWIVMEYCIAGSVTDIMQITKKKLNQNQIASILESALKGLQYLHDRKKIHRDIKAANILLDQKGNAKLADFGVSASAMHTNARFRTHIGSPYWMSPQIIKYSQYDFKTDIWSLGITAIELAEGQVPNSHVKPFMAIFQIKSNPVQSFKEPSKWSAQFNDFIKQCLQINSANRPQARQLLQHPFIKKYSKGQRLLAQLVLSSMQQIQQFRMTQSRNSSFASIFVDQARDSGQINTLIQNSQNGTVKQTKSQVQQIQNQKSINEELQGSMIILDSHRSQANSCTESVVINDNVVQTQTKKQNKFTNNNNNALSNYINGMKQMYNVQVQCAQMLISAINKYDEQLVQAANKLFEQFKNKVQNDVKTVKQLKQKNPNLQFDEQYTSKIMKSQNIEQFLGLKQKQKQKIIVHHQYIEMQKQDLQIHSKNDIEDQITIALRQKSIPQTAQKSHNDSKFNLQSTQDRDKERQHFQGIKKYQQRGPIKSFNKYQNNHFVLSQSEYDKYNKQIFNATNDRLQDNFCQPVRYGQSEGDILRNNNQNRNSSRIMMRMVDQFTVPDGDKFQKHEQLKIMTKDPDIVDYLKSKQEFKFSQSGIQHMNHTKSHFFPTYTCSKFASTNQGVFRQQRSTQQSISKSKNKSVKNLKAKKKTRIAS